ncbi:MAG TPA: urocanate hydratase [Candidatus Thermoplasmatota archaeon]|nr:urocanate hydratase [Candidatus Thermoplasmatota archaeon]
MPVGDVSKVWIEEFGRVAPIGPRVRCQGWRQEAALRLLHNNLDPAVAEHPDALVVYGGIGRAARSWRDYEVIVETLQRLKDDETMLVQSGRAVAVFKTHERAPRVLIANSNLVPKWATWEHFRELDAKGLMMYGQMTAGSWAYIGSQGIVQGTYETFAELSRQHFGGSLAGTITLTGGLGGMGGAQPLAVTMNEGVCLAVEVDGTRIQKRVDTRYLDETSTSLDDAWERAQRAKKEKRAVSIGLLGNCAEVLPEMARRGWIPDIVTDQTSAHDEYNGYVPAGLRPADMGALRAQDPARIAKLALESMGEHMRAMLAMQARGAVAFDYGNAIRAQAKRVGVERAFDIGGFVPLYIRPQFCEGRGPFRWVALSGDPEDIRRTDKAVGALFPHDASLARWLKLAREHVAFQGLPARVCWLGYKERDVAALEFNRMVKEGELAGPIVVTRDHLDAGSVASPYRETEGMMDGSDAIADWPILNALVNTAAGADIVSFHHGGGVGMGLSLHANMHVVLDGSKLAEEKARAAFLTDPGMGVVRHADAGYPLAKQAARDRGIDMPSLE